MRATLHLHVVRLFHVTGEVQKQLSREVGDALYALVVERRRIIRWLVVILVRSSEERDGRHALGINGCDIRGLVRIILQAQRETGHNVAFFDELFPNAGCSHALNDESVIFHAADHV